MEYKIAIIVIVNILMATVFIYWSGKEGKAFRKKIKDLK